MVEPTAQRSNFNRVYDTLLQLNDGGAVVIDTVGKVATVAKVLDLGKGRVNFDVIIDVNALDIVSNDELYKIKVQLSSSATFASVIVDACQIELGALEAKGATEDQDDAPGRYIISGSNQRGSVTYRYARSYVDLTGTTPSINYEAFLGARG